MSDLLNVKETAIFLRCSVPAVRLWTYQGKLAHVRLGRKVLFRKADLEALIEKNVIQAREEK